jgi:hypothetical protein
MRAIERLTGQTVERVVIPGFGGLAAAGVGVKKGAPTLRRTGGGSRRSFRPRRAGR